MMQPFDLADFLAPLDPEVVAAALMLGLVLGLVLRLNGYHPDGGHVWFMLGGGAVFFVPLSVLRSVEGSGLWERFLATYVLWCVFVIGFTLSVKFRPIGRAWSLMASIRRNR